MSSKADHIIRARMKLDSAKAQADIGYHAQTLVTCGAALADLDATRSTSKEVTDLRNELLTVLSVSNLYVTDALTKMENER